MPAGTLTLTNNSAVVKGAGTAFNTELKAGDFIVSVVGGVTYTLPVKTVDSATQATLIKAYDGPTQAGAAWYAVPRDAMNLITAQLAAETAKAMRGMNYDKENWQQVFSGTGNITVTLPDGSTYTGPSWGYMSNQFSNKASLINGAVQVKEGGTGGTTAQSGRENLSATTNRALTEGTGNDWYADFSSKIDFGMKAHGDTPNIVSPWDAPAKYTFVNYFPSPVGNIGTAIACNWGGSHEYYMNSRNSSLSGYQSWKGWVALLHSKNTTVDSNGFIKKASPIVKLFGDGSYELNEESQGVTAERVSIGVYKVTGSLGFAEEGWNIEVPQDVNGNRLCFVESSTGKDGTIYVKVSKRRFDIDTAAIVAGDPMDIPDGRWIDLRLEMQAREGLEQITEAEPMEPVGES